MKIFIVCLLFALANGQTQTVAEDLIAAQRELTIGHEFAELFLVQNRGRLSYYLTEMELQILNAFLIAYEDIKITGIETRETMDSYVEPSECKDNIRARWELQVTRYGQKLSQCLGLSDGYLKQFTGILNSLHAESRDYTNWIPNVSLNVLSELDIFDGRDNLQTYINAGFRDLLFRAFDRNDEFEHFVNEISLDQNEYIRQLTSCFRTLPRNFDNESYQDLRLIRECYLD